MKLIAIALLSFVAASVALPLAIPKRKKPPIPRPFLTLDGLSPQLVTYSHDRKRDDATISADIEHLIRRPAKREEDGTDETSLDHFIRRPAKRNENALVDHLIRRPAKRDEDSTFDDTLEHLIRRPAKRDETEDDEADPDHLVRRPAKRDAETEAENGDCGKAIVAGGDPWKVWPRPKSSCHHSLEKATMSSDPEELAEEHLVRRPA